MITNQSGIARKFYSLGDFYDLSFHILNHLFQSNIDIEINFCPHSVQDNCNCRKPKIGMIDKYPITSSDIFIGDKSTDMLAALRAGIPNRWLVGQYDDSSPHTMYFASHHHLASFLDVLRSPI